MQSRPRLKVCGVTRFEDVEFLDGVADYLGFIISREHVSPRSLEPARARNLAETVSKSSRVAVVHGYSWLEAVELVSRLEVFNIIQYHHPLATNEVLKFADMLKDVGVKLAPVSLWNGSILQPDPCTIATTTSYEYLLVDAEKGSELRYQQGLRVPLDAYKYAVSCTEKAGAAGGITPENVCLVVKLGVYLVDVSSGVESKPGHKDASKVARLVEAIKTCS